MNSALTQLFENVLDRINIPKTLLVFTRPEKPEHGTYTTNIALQMAKELSSSPRELAQRIIEEIQKTQSSDTTQIIEKLEVAGPGFINITLTANTLVDIATNEQPNSEAGKRLVIEYTQPNPFKEMHIGHLYSNAVGESLARLYHAGGWEVRRVNYQGDVGLHVGKSIWGLMQQAKEHQLSISDYVQKLHDLPLSERINQLGVAYALGSTAYEDSEQAKKEIQQVNIMAFIAAQHLHKEQSGWEPIIDYGSMLTEPLSLAVSQADCDLLYASGRTWSLEYFEERYKYLGTQFDGYYFESRIAEVGYQLVKNNLSNGIFEEHEGAIIYRGEQDGLHTRVFINSLGLPVYEAKDLGLAPTKFEDWPYDLSIVETAKEIDEYFKVILAVLKKIHPELAEKTRHVSHGLVKLPEGKMSSRTGNVKTTDWLIREVEEAVKQIMQQSQLSYTPEELDSIVHILTVATIKYSLLRVALPADISFDINHSVSLEGDSGPYLVYSYARCQSILRKVKEDHVETIPAISNDQLSPSEISLLRQLAYFQEVTKEATNQLAPSMICRYLTDLAQLFNTFYGQAKVINQITGEAVPYRLWLTKQTALTIKRGLNLLGIGTVERM